MTNIVNYAKNPSFEVNVTDDWTLITDGAGTRTRDAAQYKVGSYSCRLDLVGAGTYTYIRGNTELSIPNNGTVTLSVWARADSAPAPESIWVRIIDPDVATKASVYGTVAANGAWERLTVSWTNTSGVAVGVTADLINYYLDNSTHVWFDACQLELASAASAYTDGAQGEGHSWAGGAHNSVSTWTEPASVGFVTVIPYMMV